MYKKFAFIIMICLTLVACNNQKDVNKCILFSNDEVIKRDDATNLIKYHGNVTDFNEIEILFVGIVIENSKIYYEYHIQKRDSTDNGVKYLVGVSGNEIIAIGTSSNVIWEKEEDVLNEKCIYLDDEIIDLDEARNNIKSKIKSSGDPIEYDTVFFKMSEVGGELYYELYAVLDTPHSVRTTGWYAVNIITGEVFSTMPYWKSME